MNTSFRDIKLTTFMLSLLFSLWAIMTDDVINYDGIFYIETARYIYEGEWLAAYKNYHWPFYPLLIAAVSKAGSLSLETSAYIINITLLAFIPYIFISLLIEMGASRKVCISGALLLLLHVSLNDYRDYIIRDFGYWLFFLVSVLQLMRYQSTGRLRFAVGWNISILIATLFRIEGIVFWVFAPVIFLFTGDDIRNRIKTYFTLNSALFISMVFALAYIWISGFSETLMFSRIAEPYYGIQSVIVSFVETIPHKAQQVSDAVLNQFSDKYAVHVVWAALFVIFAFTIIGATGILALILSIYAILKIRIRMMYTHRSILFGMIAINILIFSVFVVTQFFLSGRYVMPLALLLMLPAAFALYALYTWLNSLSGKKGKIRVFGKSILLLVFLSMLIDGLVSFGSSKDYIKSTGKWMETNIPHDAKIYSNVPQIYYYSGRWVNQEAVNHARSAIVKNMFNIDMIRQYDYVSLKFSRKQSSQFENFQKIINKEPVFRDSNSRNDIILIYRINS